MKKQSQKTKKLLLDFIDAVIGGKVQLKNANMKPKVVIFDLD